MKTINITMLGPRGVGKTSMLAVLYDQFKKVDDSGLVITHGNNDVSSRILKERLRELKTRMDFSGEKPGAGLEGTSEERVFDFKMGLIGKSPELMLRFHDYPGGWISDNASAIESKVRQSHVVIVAIDAVGLMAEDGKYHTLFNYPDEVMEFLENILQMQTEKKLFLFVPIKCETWIKYADDPTILTSRLKVEYNSIMNKLRQAGHAVAVLPVQTLGNIRFSRFEKDGNDPRPYFITTDKHKGYEPKNAEQVLFYIVSFVIAQYIHDIADQVDQKAGSDMELKQKLQELEVKIRQIEDNIGLLDKFLASIPIIGGLFRGKQEEKERLEQERNGLMGQKRQIEQELNQLQCKKSDFIDKLANLKFKRKISGEGIEIIAGHELFDAGSLKDKLAAMQF
jgi:prefoldin subunit 5